MSFAAIAETLAEEFSADREHVARVFELLSAGYKIPTIAAFRRAETGCITDGTLRRFARRMRDLEEIEKRRATLLKSIEEQRKLHDGSKLPVSDKGLEALETCMDRFELEDHFLPHRRPEPEVQLAFDRGLEPLADLLVAPGPKKSAPDAPPKPTEAEEPEAASAPTSDAGAGSSAEGEVAEDDQGVAAAPAHDTGVPDEAASAEPDEASPSATAEGESGEASAPEAADVASAPSPAAVATDDRTEGSGGAKAEPTPKPAADASGTLPPVHGLHIDLSPQLARACAPFVNPDRGIHTDAQALEGAVRILSDRLGRDPALRLTLRRLMRKHGRLRVRALVGDKELGRFRPLLKVNKPVRQIQGPRLLALRQAQAQRLVAVMISVDESVVLPRVRAALGTRVRPEFQSVADAVAEQGLRQRLQPMIEDEMRNELRDRADEEAVRFVAQHLRQILMTPPAGPRPTAGVHIDAKGDWLICVVDRDGEPIGEEIKIEAGSAEAPQLATPLREALRASGARALAVGHDKGSREGVFKLRETIHLLKAEATVFLVNEAGLSNYANSESARRELGDRSVPARMAIGLARRFQDPLREFLKGDPRHLGLGREQSIVSKATLRRVLHDTVESCVAHVGCDLNTAPLHVLRHVPGLNFELAKKLVARREERPFSSREELRTEGLLDDLTWTNAIGFLRVADSIEPLDRTGLHPEQYDVVRRIILESGSSVEEALGRRDALRGSRRDDFGIDEYTWRDITREISHPGRDPRLRLFPVELLPPDTEPKSLTKDQIVEGIVSNVTSFGAFIDLGLKRDGMVHISELASRYVRDARTIMSIGQVVRARVLDPSGPRVELSLKNVPSGRRRPGGDRSSQHRGRRREGREGRGKGEAWPEYQPVRRAANSRRDGLVGDRPPTDRRRRGAGGGGGRGAGGGRGGRGGGRRGAKDEAYDPAAVREASRPSKAYNPFATFFKDREPSSKEEQE